MKKYFLMPLVAMVLGAMSAWADIPLKIVNNSFGEFDDSDIYIAILGRQGDNAIYYDMAATSNQRQAVTRQLNTSVNTLHHDSNDWGYANVFTRVSDLQDRTIYIGNTYACRMFISFKSPMYLHAFDDGGYAGADMNNPSDPNADLRWELIEFTYEPLSLDGNGQIWINTTRVDAFQYPMGLELYATGTYSNSRPYTRRGECLRYSEIINRWNSRLGSTPYAACYSNPITKDNLGGIIKQPSKVAAVKNTNIFDDYINRVWSYFTTNTANIDMGILGRWEGRVSGDVFVVTCVEGYYWPLGSQAHVGRPTTVDAIEGAGCFATGSDIDKTVQSLFCAAFNRGQFRLTTGVQNWDPENGIAAFSGGSEYPCNEYVKFFHDTEVTVSGGHTYAFAYDDTYDQSATCYTTAPTAITVTIGGFTGNAEGGDVDNPDNPDTPAGIPAAPSPAHDAANVKSFFSGAYSTITPGLVMGTWGQSTQGVIEKCGGDDAYKFTNFNYLGLQVSTNDDVVDVADMQNLHIDLYAPEAMSLNIYPISLNPTFDADMVSLQLEGGKWNSFDIPLSRFPNIAFDRLGQFKFDGGNGQTFYLDNLYMWKEGSSQGGGDDNPSDPDAIPAAPAPEHLAQNVKSFFSDSYTSVWPNIAFGAWGQSTAAEVVSLEGNNAYKFADFNYLGLQMSFNNDVVDVADMQTLHVDLYAPEAMTFNIYPISLNPTVDTDKVTLQLEAGKWNSFDIPLNSFPNVAFYSLGQFKFDGGNGQTFYLDNLYMWKDDSTQGGGGDEPSDPDAVPAAPTPMNLPQNVMSFFSDSYTSVWPDLVIGAWGQSTAAEIVSLEGNNAYRLTNFNYLGLQMSNRDEVIDISNMEYLHIDLYATAPVTVELSPISLNPTAEEAKSITVQPGSWLPCDFDLTDFNGVNFGSLGQFKLVNATGNSDPVVYFDNLYAWKKESTGIESVAVGRDENGVYDIYGRRLRDDASVNGLAPGFYIVGGRKMIITR